MTSNRELLIKEIRDAGFEPSKERVAVMHQVSSGRSAIALHSSEYLTKPYIDCVERTTERGIVVVDFAQSVSKNQLEEVTGIVDFETKSWNEGGQYFIALNCDDYFSEDRVRNLENDVEMMGVVKLLKIIQKYGSGVALGYTHLDSLNSVMDYVSMASEIHGTGSSSYYLWDLMMECAEDKVIGERNRDEEIIL